MKQYLTGTLLVLLCFHESLVFADDMLGTEALQKKADLQQQIQTQERSMPPRAKQLNEATDPDHQKPPAEVPPGEAPMPPPGTTVEATPNSIPNPPIEPSQPSGSDFKSSKIREVKWAPTNKPGTTQTPAELVKLESLKVTPGSIRKIFLVLASSDIDQKVLLKAVKELKSTLQPRFLIVQNSSAKEIANHVDASVKLLFGGFHGSVRSSYPFKDDVRMVYLTGLDIIESEGSPPAVFLISPEDGIAAISLKSKPSASQLAKVLKIISAKFYMHPSSCGVLAVGTTPEQLEALPQDYCPEDIEALKMLKLL
jgi:hypothetical protein